MQYEILFLVEQAKEEKLSEIEKSIEDILKEVNGELTHDRWEEKRKLAYPIGKAVRGTYVARRFSLPDRDFWGKKSGENPKNPLDEVVRKMNLFSDVLRYTIVRAEGLLSLVDFAAKKAEEKEMGQKKFQKSEGTDREPTIRFRKDMIRNAPQKIEEKTVVKEDESMPNTTSTVDEHKKVESTHAKQVKKEAPTSKDNTEDIDKKLDEILNM